MKKTSSRLLCGSLLLAASSLRADLFTPAPGYSASQVYATSGNQTVGGLATDSAGNLYFEVRDATPGGVTALEQLARSAASPTGFAASPSVIFQYAAPLYQGSVKVYGSELFFSDGSNYDLHTLNLNGFTVPATPLTDATLPAVARVVGLQDLAVRASDLNGNGQASTAYLSADPTGGGDNLILRLNLSAHTTAQVLDTANDYSGPLAFDHSNRLVYGRSGSDYAVPKKAGGIYQYSVAEIDNSPAQPLTLSDTHRVINNYGNSYFAMGGGTILLQTESHQGTSGVDLLHSYDLANPNSETVLGSAAAFDSFSGLAEYETGGLATLFTVVTDFSGSSGIYAEVIPEPSTSALMLLAAAGLAARRRRPASLPV